MQVIHDKSESLPVTAGELVCFKQPFRNFQGKRLLGSSVSLKFHAIQRTELAKNQLRATASVSFRRSLSGQVSLLCIIQSFDFNPTL